jgi:hypothetical protein
VALRKGLRMEATTSFNSVRAPEVPSCTSPAIFPLPSQGVTTHPKGRSLCLKSPSANFAAPSECKGGLFAGCGLGNFRRVKESPRPTTSVAATMRLYRLIEHTRRITGISPDTSYLSHQIIWPSPSIRMHRCITKAENACSV